MIDFGVDTYEIIYNHGDYTEIDTYGHGNRHRDINLDYDIYDRDL